MKKINVLCLFALFAFFIGISGTDVSADVISGITPVITEVEDISVYTANYTLVPVTLYDKGTVLKLDIPEDGFVKIRTKANNFHSVGSNNVISQAPIITRLYRDTHFIDHIGTDVTAQGVNVSDTQPLALDKGTYYIGLVTPRDSNLNDTKHYVGDAEVAVFYQKCPSQEMFQPSTPISRNVIQFDQEFSGFMSDANPIDYYEFQLNNKALVKFSYRTNTNGSTTFKLFNDDDETLLTQTYSGGFVWYNIEKYLEPGTYYCSFASSSRGQTGFKLTKTDYNLTLKYSLPYVKISTIDDVKEIRFVRGKLTNSELTSSKWYQGTVLDSSSRKFGVNKVGYYTVRVTDTYNNMFMKSIYVKKVDNKKPAKVKVTSCKAKNGYIKGKAEKNSTVYAYLNGYSGYLYSAKVNSKGVFKLTFNSYSQPGSRISIYAVDAAGNKGKISNVYWK